MRQAIVENILAAAGKTAVHDSPNTWWWVSAATEMAAARRVDPEAAQQFAMAHPEAGRSLAADPSSTPGMLLEMAGQLLAEPALEAPTPADWAALIIKHPRCGLRAAEIAAHVALEASFDTVVDVLHAAATREDLPSGLVEEIRDSVRARIEALGDVLANLDEEPRRSVLAPAAPPQGPDEGIDI